jgi:hypothetical protein
VPTQTNCAPESPCPPADYAADSVARWKTTVRRTLPSGNGHVCRDRTPADGEPGDWACDGDGNLVIKLAWRSVGASDTWASVYLERNQ